MNNRKEVFTKLSQNFKLPTPSGTALEVMRLCHSDTSSLHEIADVIQTDPALSAEVLKYANSVVMATGVQVASIQKATIKLGMNTVVTLALGFSLLAGNKSGNCNAFDYPRFWSTSLAEAVAARELARMGKECDPEEIFVCGLLAHMGNLTLASLFPVEYAALLTDQPPNSPEKKLEGEEFGIDSAELTVELFLQWGLPAAYALAAGFHEDLDCLELGTGKTHHTAVLLNLAHQIALLCQSKVPQEDRFAEVEATAAKHDVDLGRFSETFGAIVKNWHQYGEVFDISTIKCHLYNEGDEGEEGPLS